MLHLPTGFLIEKKKLRTPQQPKPYLIDSTNPKVAGIDGAVRSFVEYLYALA
jgi:hypothetical protein